MTLTFGSLFAGVGGFDLGFEAAGYECKFQVEWDKHCQQTLAYQWPRVPRWGDVSQVSGYDLPPVDVITYGFPCQDLSVAGKRAGLDGGRSGLFFEAIRIIREMREATDGLYPTFAVAENVPGLLNADGGSAMARCLDTLAEAGALAQEWCVLDAQWFGVPQRRRRVFLTACFDPATTARCPDQIFPVAKSGAWNPAESDEARQNVTGLTASSVGTGSGCSGFTQSGFATYTEGAGTLSATDHKRPEQHIVVYDQKELFTFVKVVRSGARDENGDLPPEVWREEKTAPTLNQFDQGDTRTTIAVAFHPHYHDGARPQENGTSPTVTARWGTGGNNGLMVAQPIPMQDGTKFSSQNGIGVGEEGDPMYTLDTISQNAVAQPGDTDLAVRRLTPLECERLMGWPDNHTLNRADGKKNPDSARYRMCGNGVVAPVSAWIAKHLAPLIEKKQPPTAE